MCPLLLSSRKKTALFNAQGCTVIYTKVHENPFYDSEDTELKVINSPRKVPLITGQSKAKITTINTHACTVYDMKFRENRSHDSRDTDQKYLNFHGKCPLLLNICNQIYNN